MPGQVQIGWVVEVKLLVDFIDEELVVAVFDGRSVGFVYKFQVGQCPRTWALNYE